MTGQISQYGRFLRGRPPALLGRRVERLSEVRKPRAVGPGYAIDSASGVVRSNLGATESTPRQLCREALRENVQSRPLLRQAAQRATTPAECVLVLSHLAHSRPVDEPSMRLLAEKLKQSPTISAKQFCLAASAFARARLWVATFGSMVSDLNRQEGSVLSLKDFNQTDLVQLLRFVSVFGGLIEDKDALWTAAGSRLQEEEQKGQRLDATGLVSLLRSLVQAEHPSLATWLRARLLEELPVCSPRQLASALLDLGALELLDSRTVQTLQREVTRTMSSNPEAMRPRDLASILAGYSKLSDLDQRQDLMFPLLPQMQALMPGCSVSDLCEVLHALAAAHITVRALLETWSSNFLDKALVPRSQNGATEPLSLSPSQLSLAIADLVKLRFVNQDPHGTFHALLKSVSDASVGLTPSAMPKVSPALGGLSVCHVVSALARLKHADKGQSAKGLLNTDEDFQKTLVHKLEAQLVSKVEELQPQGIAASAEAFVKLQHISEELFNCLTTASMKCLAEFSSEDFAMMSSALGTAQKTLVSFQGDVLEQFGRQAARSLTESAWTPRQVAQVLQPFSKPPEGLLHAALRHLRTQTSSYSPRDLALFLNGLQSCGVLSTNKALAADVWDVSQERLPLRGGSETLAIAKSLVQLRSVIPLGKLRYRFRVLSHRLQQAFAAGTVQLQEQAEVLRLWALLGLRDWPLLAELARNALEVLSASALRALADGKPLPLPAEDLSQAVYAYAKLGAPQLVPSAYRPAVAEFFIQALKALHSAKSVPSLPDRALRQLMLGIAFCGPLDEEAQLQKELLQEGLENWLPLGKWKEGGPARLVASCAATEFGLKPGDFSAEAAEAFAALLQPREAESPELRSLERQLLEALERFVDDWKSKNPWALQADASHGTSAPCVSINHPTPPCEIRLAVPAWKVAFQVGHAEDFFSGPREAWVDGPGWGQLAEEELDHGALLGDFVFEDETGDSFEASEDAAQWQRLPALQMRLLKGLGWTVVEVPYAQWRTLLGSEEQSFLARHLKETLPKKRVAEPGGALRFCFTGWGA
ncbi:unnamed protein product [Effrenium voratum]|nr:unnamed protein product [Effrenium voratum]